LSNKYKSFVPTTFIFRFGYAKVGEC